jgi:uncharacterized protein (TIRG00374 family)
MTKTLWLKILVSALLITWIISRTDLGRVWELAREMQWFWMVILFGLNLLGYWINSQRWRILLAAQGVRASTSALIRSFLVGTFFNQFLPTSIGGDIVRAMDLGPKCGSRTKSLSIIAFDRFVGILVLYVFTCAGLLFKQSGLTGGLVWFLAGFAPVVVGLFWLIRSGHRHLSWLKERIKLPLVGKVIEKLSIIQENLAFYCSHLKPTSKVVLLAVALQLNVIMAYYLVGLAYGAGLSLGYFFIMIPIILFGTLMPISINGIGLREGLFVYFFTSFGAPAEKALAVAWTIFAYNLFFGLVGGLVYAFRRSAGPSPSLQEAGQGSDGQPDPQI